MTASAWQVTPAPSWTIAKWSGPHSAGAIASMANQPHLRQTVYQMGGVPSLVALLAAESDSSYHAVQAVAQFAADERYRSVLAEIGGAALVGVIAFGILRRNDYAFTIADWR